MGVFEYSGTLQVPYHLYGIWQTGMAMPEFTDCISQYYPNTEGKYVQKQKQTLLLLFLFTVQVCETCKFQHVCLHFEKKMWKGISQQFFYFFILLAKFSLAQVATKNKIFLMN
jgi:hypothetical protein